MKTENSNENDAPLRALLQEWKPEASLPPRFQEQVWRRLERAQSPAVSSVWVIIAHWVGTMLPRPALAASYVALLLAVGVSAGWAQARQETARVRDELGQRYVRVLDPYQAPRP
jgi:hypothetical protein